MEKIEEEARLLDFDDQETKDLLKRFQLPAGSYYQIVTCGNNLSAWDLENNLRYASEITTRKEDSKKLVEVEINGLASYKGPYKKTIVYDVTEGFENAKVLSEEMRIYKGEEVLHFERYVPGSKDRSGEIVENHNIARFHYITNKDRKINTLLCISLEDNYQKSDFYQVMRVSIPPNYVQPDNSYVLPTHTVYRIGEKEPSLGIILDSDAKYVLKDNVMNIQGIAIEYFNEENYRNMKRLGFDRDLFKKDDLSRANSAFLYGGYSSENSSLMYALKIVKKFEKEGIEISYRIMDTQSGKRLLDDTLTIPDLNPNEMSVPEMDSVIATLLNKYPDETFVNAVVIELQKFQREKVGVTNPYPEMMTELGMMNVRTFSFDSLLENSDWILAQARKQYGQMWKNSLVEKQYK